MKYFKHARRSRVKTKYDNIIKSIMCRYANRKNKTESLEDSFRSHLNICCEGIKVNAIGSFY